MSGKRGKTPADYFMREHPFDGNVYEAEQHADVPGSRLVGGVHPGCGGFLSSRAVCAEIN
jgi:hypothetical protein